MWLPELTLSVTLTRCSPPLPTAVYQPRSVPDTRDIENTAPVLEESESRGEGGKRQYQSMWLGPLGKEHGIRPLILPSKEGGAGTREIQPFPGDCGWSQNKRHAIGRDGSGGAGGAVSLAALALLMDSDMLCWPGAGGPDP